MSFFFAVLPRVLLDKEGKLEKLIKNLQGNIVQIMGGQTLVYITRQERMSTKTLENVKRLLSQN
jgi:hypothetical protein